MKKIVKESINFTRPQRPESSMQLGKIFKIHKFFELVKSEKYGYDIDDDLHVNFKGTLSLKGIKMSDDNFKGIRIPDNLTVNGDLNLTFSEYVLLPKNLTVKGTLAIAFSDIDSLPSGLTAKYIFAHYSSLMYIPSDIKVSDGLKLEATNVTVLPDNLNISGFLDIENTNILELPKGLSVDVLQMRNTIIKSLPKDLIAREILIEPDRLHIVKEWEKNRSR